jgi:uncharacterized protein (TIGR00255 family)
MIKSMTGYGQGSITNSRASVSIEVKSLNSKFLDLSIRIPKLLNEKEPDIRNLISEKLERGKVSVTIDYQPSGKQEVTLSYNKKLFQAYYYELVKLADSVVAPSYDSLFQLALNSPDVIVSRGKDELDNTLWEEVAGLLEETIIRCDQFRANEGKSLEAKLREYIDHIEQALREVEHLDPQRIERIRQKIKTGITDFFGEVGFDANRLEQEIIYYIEKLDIHEERVRLQTHLNYFRKLLVESNSNGRKLGFLSQEIGREINTIGSKANDADIQKQVVRMKEELEKIKEQLNNVL